MFPRQYYYVPAHQQYTAAPAAATATPTFDFESLFGQQPRFGFQPQQQQQHRQVVVPQEDSEEDEEEQYLQFLLAKKQQEKKARHAAALRQQQQAEARRQQQQQQREYQQFLAAKAKAQREAELKAAQETALRQEYYRQVQAQKQRQAAAAAAALEQERREQQLAKQLYLHRVAQHQRYQEAQRVKAIEEAKKAKAIAAAKAVESQDEDEEEQDQIVQLLNALFFGHQEAAPAAKSVSTSGPSECQVRCAALKRHQEKEAAEASEPKKLKAAPAPAAAAAAAAAEKKTATAPTQAKNSEGDDLKAAYFAQYPEIRWFVEALGGDVSSTTVRPSTSRTTAASSSSSAAAAKAAAATIQHPSTSSVPSSPELNATDVLRQRQNRQRVQNQDLEQKHSELNMIESTIDDLARELTHALDTNSTNSADVNKKVILQVEENLTKTMIKIDSVPSDGDLSIRKRRKELIKKSQEMLDLVDGFKVKVSTTGKAKATTAVEDTISGPVDESELNYLDVDSSRPVPAVTTDAVAADAETTVTEDATENVTKEQQQQEEAIEVESVVEVESSVSDSEDLPEPYIVTEPTPAASEPEVEHIEESEEEEVGEEQVADDAAAEESDASATVEPEEHPAPSYAQVVSESVDAVADIKSVEPAVVEDKEDDFELVH